MDKKTKTTPQEDLFDSFKFEEFLDPGKEVNNKLITDLSDLDDEDVDKQIEEAKKKAESVKAKSTNKVDNKVETEEDDEEAESEEDETVEKTDTLESDDEAVETEEVIEITFKPLVEALGEKGILKQVENWDEFEDTDEGLEKLISETVKDLVEDYKQSLPEVVKELTDYIELGGSIESYLQAKSNVATLDNFDISTEDNQEKIVRAFLKTQEYSEDEIEEAITDYKDSLMLDKEAKRSLTKLKKLAEKEEAELIENQRKFEEQQRKEYEDYISSIKDTIMKSEEIAGLKLSEKEKRSFTEYLTKADKNGETQYSKDLKKDYMNNSIALAYFKFKNFNFEDIEKKVEKKVTKDIKSKMFVKNTKQIKGSARTPHEGADNGNFSAFKNIWGKTE